MAAESESSSPERRQLGEANAALAEAQAELGKIDAARSRLSEMASARRSEIEQLTAEISEGEAAHRRWRLAEVMEEATGPAPAALEPLRQALGKAEDDLAVLETATEEAWARYHAPKLEYEIDKAKRQQNRSIADLIRVEFSTEFQCWKRSLLLRIFWEELRSLGIPVGNDPLPSQDEATAMQRAAMRLVDALRLDSDAPLPEIGGERDAGL